MVMSSVYSVGLCQYELQWACGSYMQLHAVGYYEACTLAIATYIKAEVPTHVCNWQPLSRAANVLKYSTVDSCSHLAY